MEWVPHALTMRAGQFQLPEQEIPPLRNPELFIPIFLKHVHHGHVYMCRGAVRSVQIGDKSVKENYIAVCVIKNRDLEPLGI